MFVSHAVCVCVCRTSPSRRVKEEYAKGLTSLFPNLADPRSKFGFVSTLETQNVNVEMITLLGDVSSSAKEYRLFPIFIQECGLSI